MTATPLPKLRPLSLGELLDQVIRIYRRNFLTFVGIVALVQIPLTILQWLVTIVTFGSAFNRISEFGASPSDPTSVINSSLLGGIGIFAVGIASFVLVQGLATAALTRAIADYYLGQKLSLMEAYRKIGNSWLSLIGALLYAGLLSIGLMIWWIVPCIGWFTGLGIIFFFSSVIVPLMAPAIVLEGQSARSAWRRAWNLSRQRFWWVMGFVFVLAILGQLIITGPSTLVNYLFQIVVGSPLESANPTNAYTLQTTVQTAVSLIFSLIYLPLQLTGITLMYFDLRVRNEGFDLALLAESMSGQPIDHAAVMSNAPDGSRGSQELVTSTELGYFVLLSIAGFVIVFLVGGIFGLLGAGLMAAGGGF